MKNNVLQEILPEFTARIGKKVYFLKICIQFEATS